MRVACAKVFGWGTYMNWLVGVGHVTWCCLTSSCLFQYCRSPYTPVIHFAQVHCTILISSVITIHWICMEKRTGVFSQRIMWCFCNYNVAEIAGCNYMIDTIRMNYFKNWADKAIDTRRRGKCTSSDNINHREYVVEPHQLTNLNKPELRQNILYIWKWSENGLKNTLTEKGKSPEKREIPQDTNPAQRKEPLQKVSIP